MSGFVDKKMLIEVEKPVSLEFKYLRPSLLLGLLKNLKENEKNFDIIKIFEIGSVFYRQEDEENQLKKISILSTDDDFYSLKGKIDVFLNEFTGENIEYLPDDVSLLEKGRSATIRCSGEAIGVMGDISFQALGSLKINKKAVAAEIDVNSLASLKERVKEYESIYRVPPLIRDIAVLVPENTLYSGVFEKIKKLGGKTLKNIELFDYYKGKEIPKDKKSFAFRLYFQLPDKTLSSEEASKLQEKIVDGIDSVEGWAVRK